MAFRISVLCAAAALLCLSVRPARPEIAMAVAVAAGAAACVMSAEEIVKVARLLEEALDRAQIPSEDCGLILKSAGISLAGEYGAQLCRDAGEGALAQRVDMAVRISLLALAAPVALRALEAISKIGL